MASQSEAGLVSIITPAYNASEYLAELLESVRDQEYGPIEHIVVDDGSTDDGKTTDILKRYPSVRWWTRPNRGQYATINEALSAARGEFVLIICADDLLAGTEAIGGLVAALRRHPTWSFACGDTQIIDARGTFRRRWPAAGRCWLPRRLWNACVYAPHCSILVRSEHLRRHALGFDEGMRFAADRAWLLGLLDTSEAFGYVRRDVSKYREHATNLTVTLGTELKTREETEVFRRFGITRIRRRLAAFHCRWVGRILGKLDR